MSSGIKGRRISLWNWDRLSYTRHILFRGHHKSVDRCCNYCINGGHKNWVRPKKQCWFLRELINLKKSFWLLFCCRIVRNFYNWIITSFKTYPNSCMSGKSVIAQMYRTPFGRKLQINSTKAAVKLSTLAWNIKFQNEISHLDLLSCDCVRVILHNKWIGCIGKSTLPQHLQIQLRFLLE
jgi:hypothetical protein